MKEGRYDRVLARMLTRVERVSDRVTSEFKGTRPFDKKPVSTVDQIAQYMSLTPDVVDNLRQTMPEVWGNYEQKMNEQIHKFGGGI
jgi:hypothetical protein